MHFAYALVWVVAFVGIWCTDRHREGLDLAMIPPLIYLIICGPHHRLRFFGVGGENLMARYRFPRVVPGPRSRRIPRSPHIAHGSGQGALNARSSWYKEVRLRVEPAPFGCPLLSAFP